MQNVLTVISLKNIRANALLFKSISEKPLIAVVKDDAYGHGAEEVARYLEDVADSFAVATVDEGAALRSAGIWKDILVLTPPLSAEEVVRISAYRLTASVSSLAAMKLIARVSRELSLPPMRAHLVFNTGMNRYVFRDRKSVV